MLHKATYSTIFVQHDSLDYESALVSSYAYFHNLLDKLKCKGSIQSVDKMKKYRRLFTIGPKVFSTDEVFINMS